MQEWTRLGPANAVPEGGCKQYMPALPSAERSLFVVRRNNSLFAYVNSCPHTGAQLNWQPDEFLTGDQQFIQCTLHGALFRIDDGCCIHGPCLNQCLTALELKVKNGVLWIARISE